MQHLQIVAKAGDHSVNDRGEETWESPATVKCVVSCRSVDEQAIDEALRMVRVRLMAELMLESA